MRHIVRLLCRPLLEASYSQARARTLPPGTSARARCETTHSRAHKGPGRCLHRLRLSQLPDQTQKCVSRPSQCHQGSGAQLPAGEPAGLNFRLPSACRSSAPGPDNTDTCAVTISTPGQAHAPDLLLESWHKLAQQSAGGSRLHTNAQRQLWLWKAMLQASDCLHTACYCEENCYHLARRLMAASSALGQPARVLVVFISNAPKQVPLWRQRASRDTEHGSLVVWDYHVLCLSLGPHQPLVWDLDRWGCSGLSHAQAWHSRQHICTQPAPVRLHAAGVQPAGAAVPSCLSSTRR